MPGYFTLDFETTTSYKLVNGKRKEGIHGPTFREPNNDLHTIIYGSSPDNIKLVHKKKGFKRKLPLRVGRALLDSHTLITQNGKFDLAYIWQDRYLQKWLKNGGILWDIALVRYLLSYQRHAFPSMAEMEKIYRGLKHKQDRISWLFKHFVGADEIIARGRKRQDSYRVELTVQSIGGTLILVPVLQRRIKAKCSRLWKLYCEYGINDGRSPMIIMQKQYREAKGKGMLPIIELFNAYLLSLTMIEQNGIDVDGRQLEENERIIALEHIEYLEAASNIVKEFWSDPRLPTLNINSNDHKSLILFGGKITCKVSRETGVLNKTGKNKGLSKTKVVEEIVEIKGFGLDKRLTHESKKDGFYQTNDATIVKIYETSTDQAAKEFCRYMQLAATSKKMLTTYITGIKDRTVNGKLYPNLNNTKTITSRLSSSKINMQNIPASGRYNELIQGLFVSPPGWSCVSIDFSQLEVYVQALLSGDKKLTSDLVAGIDFHVKRMCWMPEVQALGVDYEKGIQLAKVEKLPEWEERRKLAKPIGFGKAYGKMEESMSKDTGIPLEDMKEIYRKENEEYWEVVEFDKAVALEVENNNELSKKTDFAEKYTKGTKQGADLARRFKNGIELLPIKRGKGSKFYDYDEDHLRHIGVYVSPTGKRYAFEERATTTVRGDIYKYFLSTEMKNYAVQGGASDVQAMTTVEMFQFLLDNTDKIKMLNEIHDSKWFIVKDEYLSCIIPKLCAIMSNVRCIFKRRFGIDTDLEFLNEAKVGKNFAVMSSFKE